MLVQCKKCNGKGRIPLTLNGCAVSSTCSLCRGFGKFNIPDGKKLCPDCEGIGSILTKVAGLPFTLECNKCEGTGFIDK